ncbi:glutamate ABC transporter substrate-binding protein [Streptomyces sp. NPDC004069]
MSASIARFRGLRPFVVAAAVLGLAATSACSSQAGRQNATDSDVNVSASTDFAAGTTMAKLSKAGKIRVGTKFDQPLFGLKNPVSGAPEGFDVEVAKIIAGAMGIPANKIEWVEAVSANREPFIEQGRVDMVLATYTINDERKKVISFGGPYLVAGQSLMVRSGNPKKIQGLGDLAGKKVCSVEGSASSQNVRDRAPKANVVLFDAYSKCADALKNGQVDAVTTDDTILAGLKSKDPGSFDLIGKTFTEEPYGVGVKKSDDAFVKFIDETLQKAFDDGDWAKAWDRTAGKVLGKAPSAPDLNSY